MSDAAAAPIRNVTTFEDAKSQLRDPKNLWGWLRGFAWLFLISKVLSVLGYGALTLRGMGYSPSSVTDLPITLDVLALVVLVPGSFLICVILTLILTYRLVKNLKLLNSSEMDMGPGLATWGYFIPLANLGLPVQGVGQIWRGTFSELREDTGARGAIGWWWATYLCSNLISGISGAVSRSTQTQGSIASVVASAPWVAASAAVMIVATLLFINVFGKISNGQHRMLQVSAFE